MCLFRVDEEGHSCQADRRAAMRVITPSHSAPVCPGSCAETPKQLASLRTSKGWTVGRRVGFSAAQHRRATVSPAGGGGEITAVRPSRCGAFTNSFGGTAI